MRRSSLRLDSSKSFIPFSSLSLLLMIQLVESLIPISPKSNSHFPIRTQQCSGHSSDLSPAGEVYTYRTRSGPACTHIVHTNASDVHTCVHTSRGGVAGLYVRTWHSHWYRGVHTRAVVDTPRVSTPSPLVRGMLYTPNPCRHFGSPKTLELPSLSIRSLSTTSK